MFCCFLELGCGPGMSTSENGTSGSETGGTEAVTGTTGVETGEVPTGTSSGEVPTGTTGEGSTGTTIEEGSSGEGTTAAPVCLEFHDGRVADTPVVHFTCGLPTLCGDGEPPLFIPEGNDGWTVDDLERARCMAAALRDRTPGVIAYQEPALGHHTFTIEILDEEVVLREDWLEDFNWSYDETVKFLKPTEFFAACADGSAFALHGCLGEAFTEVCGTELMCPG